MIPASEMAAMQAEAAKYLDQTCIQKRGVKTADGYGSTSTAYTNIVNAALPCVIHLPNESLLQDAAERVTEQLTWVVSVAANVDIRPLDHLHITVNGQAHILNVESIGQPMSYQVLNDCLCSEQR